MGGTQGGSPKDGDEWKDGPHATLLGIEDDRGRVHGSTPEPI